MPFEESQRNIKQMEGDGSSSPEVFSDQDEDLQLAIALSLSQDTLAASDSTATNEDVTLEGEAEFASLLQVNNVKFLHRLPCLLHRCLVTW